MKPKVILGKVKNVLNKGLTKELQDQGHFLTGALERSINTSPSIIEKSKETQLMGFALDYAQDLETGKKTFDRNHVQELVKYFLLRGLPIGEAKAAAINTARKHKEEGMPTKASSRFSKTGERKKFITRAWKENEQKVDSLMGLGMDSMFNEEFSKQKSETI